MAHASEHAGFERLLEHLRQMRGFDFTAYKRTSLMRRVRKRMQVVEISEFDAYLDFLQVHPDEFAALFNTILINVTSFFRDPEVWEVLRKTVLPELAARVADAPIRVWSAGAASGQEAYTAAMLLAEVVGIESFRERVKIYATDVDEEALAESRRAVYHAKQVADVPSELLGKYFDNSANELYSFNRDLRRSVIFGRHDLIQDAPISRVDLLLCRNTLMYFNSEAQSRIMARFYFSANPGGYLVLGRAEMLFSPAAMFQALDLKRRIFKTVPKVNHRDRLLLMTQSGREDLMAHYPNYSRLRDAAFEMSPDAQLVLDPVGTLISANSAARRQFGIGEADIGSPVQDLEVSYRPAELRPTVDRARTERRDVSLRGVAWEQAGTIRFLDIVVVPLLDEERGLLGMRVSFYDVTPLKSLQEELAHSKQELETAYEELQSTNEELETTNEELQSTVEELETTNEELQSTNEELETMNEELQSTNEELQTMNDELRNRSTELNSSNAFLEAVFTSLRSAVVVLDRDLRIQVWNTAALDMWGLRPDEAQGTSFFTLDIGLKVGELHQPIRDILSASKNHREVVLDATNRKGKPIRCRVSVAPLVGSDRTVTGAILLMEEDPVESLSS
ncbi:MAG TPA: CheR family methyltransferase [Vicinamibacterales bacterium]